MALPEETATLVPVQPAGGVITVALPLVALVMLMVTLLPDESTVKILLVEDTVAAL